MMNEEARISNQPAAAAAGQQQDEEEEEGEEAINSSNQQAPPSPPQQPRLPRTGLQRPQIRRQVIVASSGPDGAHRGRGSLELTGVPLPMVGLPVVPPKRPTRLPARYAAGLGIHGQAPGAGAGAGAGGGEKPNRYSWAQMQQWQQAAAAAAVASKQQQSSAPAGFHHHFSSPFSTAASRVLVVNPMQIVNLSEHTKSSLIKFIEAIKRFSEKWFSHVLLLLFLAVYACFGAYIFISFEAPTEHWEKQLIIDTRSRIVNESWHEAQAGSRDQFLDLFRLKLEDYERLLNRACASGMTSSSLENQWTFWGALFYSMTVFTTIGYGHLTPVTFAGRVATMVYAIFGIPILLMVLADLGKLLTRIIKYAFKKFRYLFNKLLRRKSSLKTRKLISDNTHQYMGVARDAFERGYAYVQHQPAVLRVNSFKQKLFLRQQQQQQQQLEEVAGLSAPTSSGKQQVPFGTETTEVIVTPGKQTKPVSPPIGAEKKSIVDAVIQAAHHQQAAAASTSHNNHHQSHHRSQSPAFRIKRKVSTSGLMGSRRHQQQQQQQQQHHNQVVKNSLSKSSSSNHVVNNSNSNKKLSDASNPPPVAPCEQAATSGGGAAIDEKLLHKPAREQQRISASDIDVTTDETIDVEADDGFEMEEDGTENEQEREEELEDEFDIPVSFALFLLVTYMMFGAVVFSIWEGWNFFDSLYFVFISMSTIGFGDLVPQHPKRMIGTFIYLLFGLALTSMCINVVQEKIHATFLRAKMQIGEKMGFDLDQIMADDYYDGSLVYDIEGAETTEDANSLAVSQTNSATGAGAGDHHHLAVDEMNQLVDAARRLNSQSFDGIQQPIIGHQHDSSSSAAAAAAAAAAPIGSKLSKSRESLRGKKRIVTGLPGHGNTGAISGGSMKRRPNKKMIRQATPSSSSTTATVHLAGDQPATINCTTNSGSEQPTAAINVMPLRSQIEVHNIEPMILMDQHQQQPSINAPINNVKSICEPLRTQIRDELWAGTNRPKLAATRSLQPSLQYQTEPSHRSGISPRPGDSPRAGSEAPANRRAPIKSSSYQSKSDLEAALSRRSSVSHELNQLDDLIVALGRSPSDKFGPLLGIPSSAHSSRSNSPSNQLAARRGTSMTSRPPSARPLQVTKMSSVNNMPPLNLSESQAALDELEAVKFRL